MSTKNEIEAKTLAIVKALNDAKDLIEEGYDKVGLVSKDDSDKFVRYFIQKRPVLCADGMERWSFVARESK